MILPATRSVSNCVTTPRLVSDRRSQPSSQVPIALAPVMVEAVSRAHAFAPAATPVIL